MTVIETRSPEETEAEGERFAARLIEHRETDAFVALRGEMGAGKTVFVRGMARAVTPGARVCSPTYAIVNEYRRDGKAVMLHYDMYRITGEDDLISTGFFDICDCIRAVEWSENIPYALPEHYYTVTVEYGEGNTRRITFGEK